MQLEYLYAISIVLLACQEIVLLLDTPSSTLSLHSGSVLTWLAADFEISHFREHHTLRTCNIVRFAMSWSWTPWAPGAWCPRPRPATTRPPDIRGVRTAPRVCVHCIVSAEHVRDQGLSSWSHGAMG